MLEKECDRVAGLEGQPGFEKATEKLKRKAAKQIYREQDWNSHALLNMYDNRIRKVIKNRAPYCRMIFALYTLAQTVLALEGMSAVKTIHDLQLSR